MQHKAFWWIRGLVVVMVFGALSAGFNANPAPQPQRLADLIARLDALEEENRAQQATLDAFGARLDALELLGSTSGAVLLDPDVVIPREWVEADSSDGVVRYRYDPAWELSSDEPGTLELWIGGTTSLFFSWDWSVDLLDDLRNDEDFFRLFEKDLVWSDATIQMETTQSGTLDFMGETAYYWSIDVESADGFDTRMLTIFYPCSDRTSCNLLLMRFDDNPEDKSEIPAFTVDDWNFANTFANGLRFLTDGEASVSGNANLRACPATSCEVVGRLVRGEIVNLVAISEDGLWVKLQTGEWLAASLVFNLPTDLPVEASGEGV